MGGGNYYIAAVTSGLLRWEFKLELQVVEDEKLQADNFGLFQKPKSHGFRMSGTCGVWALSSG
jgi:hypothetical protein